MERIFSPSPTVRSSRVPLYMQGISRRLNGLGDDTVSLDPTIYDPGNTLTAPTFTDPYANYVIPINLTPQAPIDTSMVASSSSLIAPTFNPVSQPLNLAPAAAAAAAANQLAAGLKSIFSPSPRVSAIPTTTVVGTATPGTSAASFLNQQSIPGIPNTLLLGGAALLLVVGMGKKR